MKFGLVHSSEVNRRQRVVLAASTFDDDVLMAAEWLSGTYGVDIVCARFTVMFDPVARTEYLECNRLFPAKQQSDLRTHAAQPVHRPEDLTSEEAATADADFGGWADLACLSEGVAWR
jgi:hypothetical protein